MDVSKLLGWIDFKDRTNEQNDVHDRVVGAMPAFSLGEGDIPPKGTKIVLTDFWGVGPVVKALGNVYTGIHQLTGSCVWAGFENAAQTLNFIEVCKLKQPEAIKFAFFLYNYGRSRLMANMRGRGEGSLGSTMAKSADGDGYVDARDLELNLPKEQYGSDGIHYTEQIEYEWSDGSHASQLLREKAKKNRIISAPISSAGAIRKSIINGYPCTRAGGVYVNPGTASVREGALIGRYNGRGGHQTSYLGYWHHPILGELFLDMNQWGRKVYGADPGGAAGGSVWVGIDEVERFASSQYTELYSLTSNESGFVEQPIFDWLQSSFVKGGLASWLD